MISISKLNEGYALYSFGNNEPSLIHLNPADYTEFIRNCHHDPERVIGKDWTALFNSATVIEDDGVESGKAIFLNLKYPLDPGLNGEYSLVPDVVESVPLEENNPCLKRDWVPVWIWKLVSREVC